MDESALARQMEQARLEQLKLENEKLAAELTRMRERPGWRQAAVQWVPLITALVSIAGFLWGVLQYTEGQAKNRAQERITADREFMRPWLENQRSTYAEALSAAAAAVHGADAKERAAAQARFWQLYHGRMVLVETKAVSGAMVGFGECMKLAAACPAEEAEKLSRALATAMAASMAATAKMPYPEFVANQFQY